MGKKTVTMAAAGYTPSAQQANPRHAAINGGDYALSSIIQRPPAEKVQQRDRSSDNAIP